VKAVERNILPFQEKIFFSPIRDKTDYVRVLVHAARLLLLNYDTSETPTTATMKLIVDKMSRLFFYKDAKYFSISFPFIAPIDGNNVSELTTYLGKKLDNKGISAIISVIDSAEFQLNPSLVDITIDSNNIDLSELALLEEILLFEPSYIRFDFDPTHENGKLHPLNHLDINYSQYGAYKFGLHERITKAYFENLQNINTDCSYVID
jgi:hypothetical protein